MGMLLELIGFVIFFLFMNAMYERTPRYQNEVLAVEKFRQIPPEELFDIINTGSNYAWYDIDYESAGVHGLNLASGSQSLTWDEILLKRYLPQVRQGLPILIGLADLVFCFTRYANDASNRRYYHFLPWREIPGATLWKKIRYDVFPILGSWKNIFHCVYHRGTLRHEEPNTLAHAKAEAAARLTGWQQQFSLPGFQTRADMAHLASEIDGACAIVARMIALARETHHPVAFVVMPSSKVLLDQMGAEFLDAVLYEPMRRFPDVPVLDYMHDERFQDWRLYQDADFMNAEGRKRFTAVLLSDVERLCAEGRMLS